MPKPVNRPTDRGVITAVHPNAMFTIRLTDGRDVSASLSGKLRTYYTRLTAGDRVHVELSPLDQTRGRIVDRDGEAGEDPGAAQRVLR